MKNNPLIIFLILLLPMMGWGLTLKKTSIAEMTRTSDLIIQGTILSNHSEWNDEKDLIYTFYRIQINDIYKGSVSGDVVTVRQLGGRIGDSEMILNGAPGLREGEDVLLFLMKKGSFYVIHSIALGKFSLQWDSQSGRYMAVHSLYGVNLLDPQSGEEIPGSDHNSRYPLSEIVQEVRRAIK